LTLVRQIAARMLEKERQREASRQAAIDAALAKPPCATEENWNHWHRTTVASKLTLPVCRSDPRLALGGSQRIRAQNEPAPCVINPIWEAMYERDPLERSVS
jgi:hypothetical protein